MNDPEGFYVDLVSNSSSKFFINNTLSNFATKLHRPIEFNKQWQVGMSEMFYPFQAYTVRKDVKISIFGLNMDTPDNRFMLNIGTSAPGLLESGYYNRLPRLVNAINKAIDIYWSRKVEKEIPRSAMPRLEALTNRHVKLHYGVYPDKKLVFYPAFSTTDNEDIERILGFKKMDIIYYAGYVTSTFNTLTSRYEADLKAGRNFIYVYTDIIREHLVGDTSSSLLRVVPLSRGKFDDIGHLDFNPVMYFDVKTNRIESIYIKLCDENGEHIVFTGGRVHITLHFKPKE